MMLHVPQVLTADQVVHARDILDRAKWIDGRATAGHQSTRVKNNQQLAEDSAEARELGDLVMRALEHCPLFITASLPLHVFPPLFNRYGEGMGFGMHLDNSVRRVPGTGHRIRTDVSATLFLSAPEEYDGGELVVEDVYGAHSVKLPAGDLVLYPASSLHQVTPVTRGARLGSFFWVQSMVRDAAQRSLLFDLDLSIQQVRAELSEHPAVVSLTHCYHNLLRRFAEL